jgi:uncharacterized protein DUF4390
MHARLALGAAVAALVALPPLARSDDTAEDAQHMHVAERGDVLTLTTKITKLFDEAAFHALDSGFQSNVVITVAVYSRDTGDPIQVQALLRTVVYDLWDEVYTVQIDNRKPMKVRSPAEVLKLLTSIDDAVVANIGDMAIGEDAVYYIRLNAQLNPVDKQTLTQVRRWLSQGNGGGLDRGGAFFGSFVSVFVNPKIAEADRVLRLRSQPFYLPSSP